MRIIRQARERGVKVTAETAPHYLLLTDEALKDFGTSFKVSPPLRSAEDVAAVRAGLRDGTIEVIACDHAPHSAIEKEVEFEYAANGMVGLETSLGLCWKLVEEGLLTPSELIARMTVNAARVLRIPGGTLKKGAVADVTVIDPKRAWTVDIRKFRSKSRNSPFDGWKLPAKAVLTIVGERSSIMNYRLEVRGTRHEEEKDTFSVFPRTSILGPRSCNYEIRTEDKSHRASVARLRRVGPHPHLPHRRVRQAQGDCQGGAAQPQAFRQCVGALLTFHSPFSRRGSGGLAFIEGSDVINHFAGIRADLDRTLIAAYVAELADHFSVEGKKNLPLFELLTDFLGFIECGQMTETAERFFELRLLKSAGFEPVLDRCVTCGTPLETIESPRFDCREGGIRCARCTVNSPDFIPVSVGTLKTLLLGSDIDFAKMPRVGLSGPHGPRKPGGPRLLRTAPDGPRAQVPECPRGNPETLHLESAEVER